MHKDIYGVFIHTWQGKIGIGLFPKESALGLVRILEDRFDTDGDDMTGAFGPIDCSQPYLILYEDEWYIFSSDKFGVGDSQTFAMEYMKENIGKLYDCETKEFRNPEESFEAWYSEDDELEPVTMTWTWTN